MPGDERSGPPQAAPVTNNNSPAATIPAYQYTGHNLACSDCGATPERPNREARRQLARKGHRTAPLTVQHQRWCPLHSQGQPGGSRGRRG